MSYSATVTYDFDGGDFEATVSNALLSASAASFQLGVPEPGTGPQVQQLAERSDGVGGIVFHINQRSFNDSDLVPMSPTESGIEFMVTPDSGGAIDLSFASLTIDVSVFSDGASVMDSIGLYAIVGGVTSAVDGVKTVINPGGGGNTLDLYDVGTTSRVSGWNLTLTDTTVVTDTLIFNLSELGELSIDQSIAFKIAGLVNKNNTANFNSCFDQIVLSLNSSGSSNTVPIALDDAYSVARGMDLNVAVPGVLMNDEDGDVLSALLIADVDSGWLTLNADGSFDYTAADGYTGTVGFTYAAIDGVSTGNTAAVSIQVYEPIAVERPNILIFFADDMGIGDSRIYNQSANMPPAQPTIEGFASSGMVFNDAHTQAALCAPSRYSILTGNYPWRGRTEGGSWHMNKGAQVMLGQQTLAHVLNSAGYHSAIFGKGHLGGYLADANGVADTKQIVWNLQDARDFLAGDTTKQANYYDPTKTDWTQPVSNGVHSALVGFDYSFMLYGGIQDPLYAYFENDYIVGNPADLFVYDNPHYMTDNGDHWTYRPGYGLPDWYTCDVGPTLTRKTLDYIDAHLAANEAGGTEEPFFIHYCAEAVHSKHTPPIDFLGTPVAGETGSSHSDMLLELEVAFSNILHKLEVEGLLEDTLVIFTSDNGGLGINEAGSGHNPNEGLRGYKASIWEGGHRVPLFVKWGDRIPAGSYDHMVGVHDIYATLAQLVGKAQGNGQGLDAVSFLSVLLSGNQAPVRDHLLCRGNSINKGSQDVDPIEFTGRAVREGAYKLVTDMDGNPLYLFDLADDSSEGADLLSEPAQAERLARMSAKMDEYVSMVYDYSHPSAAPRSETLPPYRDLNGNGMDDDWEMLYFGSTNAPLGGAEEDFDADSIVNLLEFSFGSNPALVNDPAAVLPEYAVSGDIFEYIYRRRQDASAWNLFYTNEQTDNLMSNRWSSAGVTEAGAAFISADIESVTNQYFMTGTTNRFFRLQVEAK